MLAAQALIEDVPIVTNDAAFAVLNAAKININLGHPIANTIAISAIGAVVVIILARLIA